MPKAVITGHTSGIGLSMYNHFISKGWEVIGFNTTTGLYNFIKEAHDCDLFINNKYESSYMSPKNIVHLFWMLLYDIIPYISKSDNKQTAINNLCNKILRIVC